MHPRVDTALFPVGHNIDYDSAEEVAELADLEAQARDFMGQYRWTPPIEDMVLAFGIGQILALFLVRFAPGGKPEDAERWVVAAANGPNMHFETDDTPTPALALKLYCAIGQDWADTVIAGGSLDDSYPIPVAPTREHAEILLWNVEFIRKKLIPIAWGPPWKPPTSAPGLTQGRPRGEPKPARKRRE